MRKLSIIVLIRNDTEGLSALITRIDSALNAQKIVYEIIFVANTPNETVENTVKDTHSDLPLRSYVFDDEPPHRLFAEAVAVAKYPLVGFVNIGRNISIERVADVLSSKNTSLLPDVIIARRRYMVPEIVKLLFLKCIEYSYGVVPIGFIFNREADMQVVRKELLSLVAFDVSGPRLNSSLLTRIKERGGVVVGYAAESSRSGVMMTISMKAGTLKSAFSFVQHKVVRNHYEELDPAYEALHGTGFRYRGQEYITHNTLPRKNIAVERTTLLQRCLLLLVFGALLLGVVWNGTLLLVIIVSLVTVLYFCDLLFNMFLIYRSLRLYNEIKVSEEDTAHVRSWPRYTILCPLYKEVLVVPQFTAAMRAIDYPKEQLEVLLLLESNDKETIAAIRDMDLPDFFKTIVVPHSLPKTKPKACNYGLHRATGEYSVIYDAEDIPDPLQLKKAVIAFERSAVSTGCVQAKLNYYNWNQNLLTRLFTLEYSLWFNLILTGLQSIKAPIPLGGTSNHFRTSVLRELGGWDPFNVTEDADLGIRLSKRGLTTTILDSTTYEEANSELGNWLRQRSRWIKGYMQTYLVHMRDVRELGRNSRRIDMVMFQLIIGGKIVSMLVNPLLWAMTLGYFLYRNEIGGFIESLYITPIFYIGAFALIIGNFLYLYYYMIGSLRQNRPELAAFALFVPFYWLMMSVAAGFATYDLIVRPFHWHKTKHGLHLKKIKTKGGTV
jgi:cellulose synthase/poly-beta-1,6-N-acetylglucosamine synthase-like glycosyltransferase